MHLMINYLNVQSVCSKLLKIIFTGPNNVKVPKCHKTLVEVSKFCFYIPVIVLVAFEKTPKLIPSLLSLLFPFFLELIILRNTQFSFEPLKIYLDQNGEITHCGLQRHKPTNWK